MTKEHLKEKMEGFMWLMQYSSYDSTTPYIASTKQIVKAGG